MAVNDYPGVTSNPNRSSFPGQERRMNRRHFLMSSAAALGAAQSVFGSPNDTLRVGVIGVGGHRKNPAGGQPDRDALGGRGKDHLMGFSKLENVQVAAVADVDPKHLEYGLGLIE